MFVENESIFVSDIAEIYRTKNGYEGTFKLFDKTSQVAVRFTDKTPIDDETVKSAVEYICSRAGEIEQAIYDYYRENAEGIVESSSFKFQGLMQVWPGGGVILGFLAKGDDHGVAVKIGSEIEVMDQDEWSYETYN